MPALFAVPDRVRRRCCWRGARFPARPGVGWRPCRPAPLLAEPPPFLGVAASVTGRRWQERCGGAAVRESDRQDGPGPRPPGVAGPGPGGTGASSRKRRPVTSRRGCGTWMPDPHTLLDVGGGRPPPRPRREARGDDGGVRRLRCRRRRERGAPRRLSPQPGTARADPHPRPDHRGLRPQRRGDHRAGGGGRDTPRLRRLRDERPRAAGGGRRNPVSTSSSSTTTRLPRSSPRPRRGQSEIASTTCRASAISAPPASSS